MSRKPTAEQQARFERFCAALTDDIRADAYRAAIRAGYTLRMAKSKSYKLACRHGLESVLPGRESTLRPLLWPRRGVNIKETERGSAEHLER